MVALSAMIEQHPWHGQGFDRLRLPIRHACLRARRDAVLQEQLLIELEHGLLAAPEFVALSPAQRDRVHDWVIQFSIKAYFEDGQM